MKRLAAIYPVLITIAMGLWLAGCRDRQTPVEWGNTRQILHLGNGLEPPSLDPHLTSGLSELNIQLALFEGLLRPDPQDLSPRPGLAESWTVSPDGLVYTFSLRPDLRWSDGAPLTSGDCRYAWERVLHPDLAAANAFLFFPVQGAAAYNNGTERSFDQTGFQFPDRRTVIIRLTRPAPWFPSMMLHPVWSPLPEHCLEAHQARRQRGTAWTRPDQMASSGPFRLERHLINESIVLTRNPRYHAAGAVRLQEVHFYPIENRFAEELAFFGGRLHVTYGLPSGKAAFWRRRGDPRLRLDAALATEFLCFNTRLKPLDDRRVRAALHAGLERQRLVDKVLGGGQAPARTFTPPGWPAYRPPETPDPTLAQARQWLAEAGYPNGRGFPRLELLFSTSDNNRRVAEAVQEMWRRNLGIRIDLVNQEYTAWQQSRISGQFDITRGSWFADYADPQTFLDVWRAASPHNYSGWHNQRYEELLDRSADGSIEDRLGLLRQAEAVLLDDLPMTPLFHNVSACLIDPAVRGWPATPLNWHPLEAVWLSNGEETGLPRR